MEKQLSQQEKDRRQKRLAYWLGIVKVDESAWAAEREKMGWREELYAGTKTYKPTTDAEAKQNSSGNSSSLQCYHVRNIIAENIETMVDSSIPSPKVIAMRKNDEALARKLEHMLKFFVKRKHLHRLNDLAERVCPQQGGVGWLVEWDNSICRNNEVGDVVVSMIHPRQFVPQAGIYTSPDDMDHFCFKQAITKRQALRRWGVDVGATAEEDADIRGRDAENTAGSDLVTMYTMYYRNDRGGIGQFAWIGDKVILDLDDYQARHMLRCKQCGAVQNYMEPVEDDATEDERKVSGELSDTVRRCPWCEGTEFEEAEVAEEAVILPETIMSVDAEEIELLGAESTVDENGNLKLTARSTIPYYKPNSMPVVLQKNISQYGRLLGESDVDKLEDQQNTIKRMDKKMIDRIVTAGTIIGLPPDTHFETDVEDQRVLRFDNEAQAQLVRCYDFTGNLQWEYTYANRLYEEARQEAGVTDSYQGRKDSTAPSAKAKEFSAAQAAGRMESKRTMKREAWAAIYERIAKLMLAYCDEERSVRVETASGDAEYEVFRRKDFLKRDKAGNLYYEDGFIFSTEDASALSENREAMWQSITQHYQSGALGDPTQTATRVMYWGLLEEQGYPNAGAIRKKLEDQAAAEKAAATAAQTTQNPQQAVTQQQAAPQMGQMQ